MKITKSKLKQIIKEELSEAEGGADYPEIDDRIVQQLKDLHEAWRPETEEGQQYKGELGNLISEIEPTWQDVGDYVSRRMK